MDRLVRLQHLRRAYLAVRDALPWLDATVREEEDAAFADFAKPLRTPHVGRNASRHAAGTLTRAARLGDAAAGAPLVVRHTDVDFPQIASLARAHPELAVIVESGPQKILYFIDQLEDLLSTCENVCLSTYNLCNWLGLERLWRKGLASRLLYGSHWPAYDPDVAMGPIVMGQIPWQGKCAIAGNNLRRLLGLPLEQSGEVPFVSPDPFIIDAHAHNVDRGVASPYDFPVPDEQMAPADWTAFMDGIAVERLLTIPARALWHSAETSRDGSRQLRTHAPGRFSYFEVFNPTGDADHVRRLERSLVDSDCVGIKIHPSFHGVAADDDAYTPVYELARRHDKPILTHSWEASSTNPVQHLSHPDRFRAHLERHPDVRFVLGHAGGRPSTFDAVVAICDRYPRIMVDIAGDTFDNGFVDALVARVGVDRVLFGSDVDWIDPRSMLGAVLGSGLSDRDALRVLRHNALGFYGPRAAPR